MRRLASILSLLLALTGACTRDSVIYGQCDSIYDCRTGQACLGTGYCGEGAAPPAGLYGIELLPATYTAGGPVRSELPKVSLGGGDVALGFEAPVELSGVILLAAPGAVTDQRSVAAAVTLTRKSSIGLTDATYSVTAAADKAEGDVAFSLRLPPTKTITDPGCEQEGSDCYELRVVPAEGVSLPPLVKRIPLATSTYLPVALNSLDVINLTGTVKDAALNGQGGLEVRAVNGEGRTVSSVKTTSTSAEKLGEFVLSLSTESVKRPVWLQVSDSQQSPNVPKFLFALDAVAGATEDVGVGDVVLLDFRAPLTMTYRVTGAASNGQKEGLEGVVVRFTTYLTEAFSLTMPSGCTGDTCAVYTRQATTNADGEVTLSLIPPGTGGYEVDILPGPNSPYSAMHVGGVEVVQAGLGADFSLERKLEIRGTVINAQGLPVAGATVAATPRASTVPAPDENGGSPGVMKTSDLALEESPSSVPTDAAGQFLLTLEPQVKYDLVVTPSSASSDPVTTMVGQEFAQAATISIQLPEAALLAGTVAAWEGIDTAGTLVRVYETVQIELEPAEFATYLRGEAVVTEGGEFKLLLPSAQAVVQ